MLGWPQKDIETETYKKGESITHLIYTLHGQLLHITGPTEHTMSLTSGSSVQSGVLSALSRSSELQTSLLLRLSSSPGATTLMHIGWATNETETKKMQFIC